MKKIKRKRGVIMDSHLEEQRAFEAGLDVRNLTMVQCRDCTLQKQNKRVFVTMMPVTVLWPSPRLVYHLLIF